MKRRGQAVRKRMGPHHHSGTHSMTVHPGFSSGFEFKRFPSFFHSTKNFLFTANYLRLWTRKEEAEGRESNAVIPSGNNRDERGRM